MLVAAYHALASSIRDEHAITPAAEWLVDNFHIVDEQLRQVRDDLPDEYYRELPKLADGHLAGYPRVLGLAWAYVAHTGSRFDAESLRRMVDAYQRVQPLTIGELWAIAISLRIVLVENLRRSADQILQGRAARQEADRLADRVLGADGDHPLPRDDNDRLSLAAKVQLFQRLRDQDPATTPALVWLEERLAKEGTTAEETVRREHQSQAEMNLRVRNVITTMRVLSSFDWPTFVESVSLVDRELVGHPGFEAMDFATRDGYRHAVESLARRGRVPEVEVAAAAVDAARAAEHAGAGIVETQGGPASEAGPDREADPGYHLLAEGRPDFERRIGAASTFADRFARSFSASAWPYAGSVALVTLLVLVVGVVVGAGGAAWPFALIIAVLALGPASDIAVALVNRAVARFTAPARLPRLELRDGVPTALRTVVAVPTLLVTDTAVEEQVRRLEIHFLGNPDGDVRFALVTDWVDAPAKDAPGDDELLATAAAAIERLNARYGEAPGGGARFLLFHRARRWNPVERRWMGWERKRGKLHELNALLRGARDTSFLVPPRPFATPPAGVRYVVTLDADTRLPRGAVTRLVGTIAHPLNRAVVDVTGGRVVRGYGILQPRITPTLPAEGEASIFQRVYAGPAGIDPYASAVSDVYQDLFGEGSYTGKGIYDLGTFERVLADRAPENALLSHDLFEGTFARAGLVTDVEVFEDFPSNYLESAARQHRWARGDWQLLPWIAGGRGIPGVGRWKMVDNLRRTLSAPLALGTLLVAWTAPGVSAAPWTLLVLAAMVVPALIPLLAGLLQRRPTTSWRSHLRAVGADLGVAVTLLALGSALLAHQALLMADAIGRTLIRLGLTHRNLLEWTTASQTKGTLELGLGGFYRSAVGTVTLAAATGLLVLIAKPGALLFAVPFVAAWLASPAIAWWISRPQVTALEPQLEPAEVRSLRLLARQTWRFFETFVGTEDHALPPDNYQEHPLPAIAHRTSPTNIGMYLLSVLTARDFGWIGTVETVERLEATLATIERLERHGGHLLNWYDTRDLRALEPRYVSSVDSGNLCAALLVVTAACREMLDGPRRVAAARTGTLDAVELARLAFAAMRDDRRTQTVGAADVAAALAAFAPFEAAAKAARESRDGALGSAEWAATVDGLRSATATLADIVVAFTAERGDTGSELLAWAERARATAESHARDIALMAAPAAPSASSVAHAVDRLDRRLATLAHAAGTLFGQTDFTFLFDGTRKLFSIGYRVAERTMDPSYYDLLASEARIASFLAIAKGDVPADHWFRLGRPMTPVGRGSALISWSGSMFEYLMPALVMDAPVGSLLDQTYELVVDRQIQYARERGVPWGISESALNARDLDKVYQYAGFGIPGLGLKRGLADDVVIAPYASALAAMVRPKAAAANLARLGAAGASGPFGLAEALDYTPRRLPVGATVAVVRSYMAHHQGMLLVAIGNVLNRDAMIRRFHGEPIVAATELLLQERMPRDVLVARLRADEVQSVADVRELLPPVLRRFATPHDFTPRTHLLSNGRYAVMVTAAGGGYSRWGDQAVTRWREDTTCDAWGTFLFLRDATTGAVWSAAHQPSGVEADSYEVRYSEEHAEFSRRDGSLVTATTVVVTGEHDGEIRRVSLTNLGAHARVIDVTSYAEVVLAPQAADLAHPAFGNLFVQTEFAPAIGGLLATRRPRSRDDAPVWAAHVVAVEDEPHQVVQYETDRARFLGRGRSIRTPVAVMDGRPLSNTVGAVLDPVFSLRVRVTVPAGGTAHVVFSTVVAGSRAEVLDLADNHRDAATFQRAATLAWTQAQVQLRHLGIDGDEAHLFQRLANRVLYADPSLRPPPALLAANDRGASGLWPFGISGDLPIVVVRIDHADDIDIVRQLLRAHEYWRMKLLDVDLVVINEHAISYAQDLQDTLETAVRTSQSSFHGDQPPGRGGVFVLRGDRLAPEVRTLLQTAARAVLLSRHGTLAQQVLRLERPGPNLAPVGATGRRATPLVPAFANTQPTTPPAPVAARPDLEFFNGIGGFGDEGREYVITLGPGQATPAPWINVIANEAFGFTASESGSGYTWAGNSRENQLTPWWNDPVSDPAGEAIFVRDEDDGELWGPTALPIRREDSTYTATHGMGYSRFGHDRGGIHLDLVQFVPLSGSVKTSVLRIENRSGRARRLSVTAYAEWVLGTSRGISVPHIVTSQHLETGAILARNAWNTEFGARVAFLDMAGRQAAWTTDRTEFLGRNGSLERPAGLVLGHRLARTSGAALDPCGVLQAFVELAPGESTEVTVLLGQADDTAGLSALIAHARAADHAAELRGIRAHWKGVTGAVQARTPDRSMDVLLNGWLLYQTLSCRIWARTGLYQAGGAFGFRDQLQDVLALTGARPDVARAQLLRASARQFPAGDVQHWWHPPTGRGVRTRISDDRLWLPFVTARYIESTGDTGVLDERAAFIDGPALRPGQEDAYFQPETAASDASLYEHGARAIDVSLTTGEHGLPLIGSGDWNDAMNRVGREGRGESVWLGWFLYAVIEAFAPIAEARGDGRRAAQWRAHAAALVVALEAAGWDGAWYRRGYFDDGSPLGSASSEECRIDSIAQSWAVLSGAGDADRARRAMDAVSDHLILRDTGLALLLTPPFDRSAVDPGYIKGYLPGIRENGGQYTHGAIWSVLAFAGLGDGDRAAQLFAMLNPINHAATRAGVQRYRIEPYVMPADVYAEASHVGRGGWSWYTGSAGWMYQAGMRGILGLEIRGAIVTVAPSIPRAWAGYELAIRYGSSMYRVRVQNPDGASTGVSATWLDGQPVTDHRVPGAAYGASCPVEMRDDGREHEIRVVVGAGRQPTGATPPDADPVRDDAGDRDPGARTAG